jgi:hypothetical protein
VNDLGFKEGQQESRAHALIVAPTKPAWAGGCTDTSSMLHHFLGCIIASLKQLLEVETTSAPIFVDEEMELKHSK